MEGYECERVTAVHSPPLCPACMEVKLERKDWTALTPYTWFCPGCGTTWEIRELIAAMNMEDTDGKS